MNLYRSFFVKPAANEVVETKVSLSSDARPALIGTVLDLDEKPVGGALVTLYQADDSPVGALYTDDNGRFTFGPLSPGQLYHVRIFKSGDKLRALEQQPD